MMQQYFAILQILLYIYKFQTLMKQSEINTHIIKNQDIIVLKFETKNFMFHLTSQGYYPNSANLKLNDDNIESLSSFFKILRKNVNISNAHKSTLDIKQWFNQSQNFVHDQGINFQQIVILVHCVSGRYLSIKQSSINYMNLYLTDQYSKRCQFKFFPVYKCQTISSKKIHQGQQILLASYFLEEGYNFYISIYQSALNRQIKMQKDKNKKFQASDFTSDYFFSKSSFCHTTIHKKIDDFTPKKNYILTRQLYRLSNIQIQKYLSFSQGNIIFHHSLNDFESFIEFIAVKNPNQKIQIANNEIIYIRFRKEEKYIEIISSDSIKFTTKPNKNCEFSLIQYSPSTKDRYLKNDGIFFIYHLATSKYLSIEYNKYSNQVTPRLNDGYSLRDTMKLSKINQKIMHKIQYLNQLSYFLENMIRLMDDQNVQHEQFKALMNILEKLLEDIIMFLYKIQKQQINQLMQKFKQLIDLPINNDNQSIFMDTNVFNLIIQLLEGFIQQISQIQLNKVQNKNKKLKVNVTNFDIIERENLFLIDIKYCYIIIAGICQKNINNSRQFIKNIKCMINSLELDLGSIECIIHIFKNNTSILEEIGEKIKIEQKSIIKIFIQKIKQIYKQRKIINKAIFGNKILNLLEYFIIINNKVEIKSNQNIIGEQFRNNLERELFIQIATTPDDKQLIIKMTNDKQIEEFDLQEFYSRKSKYSNEILLVQKQLNLYSKLCYNRNLFNIQFFQVKLPCEYIIKYYKKNIDDSLNNILLDILMNIYLDVSPRKIYVRENIIIYPKEVQFLKGRNSKTNSTSVDFLSLTYRLLNKVFEGQQGNNEYEMQSIKNDNKLRIEQIKKILFEQILKSIQLRRFNQNFPMIIECIGKFISFNLLTTQQQYNIKKSLSDFINFNQDNLQSNYVIVIIKILLQFEELEEERKLKQLIIKLITDKKLMNSNKMHIEGSYLNQIINTVIYQSQKKKELQEKQQLFFQKMWSKYVHLLNDVGFVECLISLMSKNFYQKLNMIKNLRYVLVLETRESVQTYKNLKDYLVPELESKIQNFIFALVKEDSNNLISSIKKLLKNLEQINICFYQDSNPEAIKSQHRISIINQHIFRQVRVHKIIIKFLSENFKEIKVYNKKKESKEIDKIFKYCFNFLTLFIQNQNKINLKIIKKSFSVLKKYLEVNEVGQSEFLLELAKIDSIKYQIEEEMIYSCLDCLAFSQNVYLISIFIEYTKKRNLINRKFIDYIVNKFLADESYFENLLKMRKVGEFYQLKLNEETGALYLYQILYYIQVFKFLNIVLENISQKKYLHNLLLKYVSLETILRILQLNDIFEQIGLKNIYITILQRQVLKLFYNFYIEEMKNNKINRELLEVFCHKNYKKIHLYNNQLDQQKNILLTEFLQNNQDSNFEILSIIENIKSSPDNHQHEQFIKSFNFTYYLIVRLAPLIGELMVLTKESEREQLSEISKKQLIFLFDSFSNSLQQSIEQLLIKTEFEKYKHEYINGLQKCYELFRRKIKLSFQYSNESQKKNINDGEEQEELTGLIQDKRLSIIVSSYKSTKSQIQKKSYRIIYNMLFNPNTKKIITQENYHLYSNLKKILNSLDKKIFFLKILVNCLSQILIAHSTIITQTQERVRLKLLINFVIAFIQSESELTEEYQNIISETNIIENGLKYIINTKFTDKTLAKYIISLFFKILSSNNNSTNLTVQTKFQSIFNQLPNIKLIFECFKVYINEQKEFMTTYFINQQRMSSYVSEQPLAYQSQRNSFNLKMIIKFYTKLIEGKNTKFKIQLNKATGIVDDLLDLVKIYLKFIFGFNVTNKIYYSYAIHKNLNLCLESILYFINYQAKQNINICIQKNFKESVNLILSLDDSLIKIQEIYAEKKSSELEDLINRTRNKDGLAYLKFIQRVTKNSNKFYEELSPIKNSYVPLIPNFYRTKTNLIRILYQVTDVQENSLRQLFFQKISESTIKKNIVQIYEKHLYTQGNNYEIFAYDKIYNLTNQFEILNQKQYIVKTVENSNYIQNGFLLVFILFKIYQYRNDNDLEKLYERTKRNSKIQQKFLNVLTQGIFFLRDVYIWIFSKIKQLIKKKSIKSAMKHKTEIQAIETALKFFLLHSGRIQIIKNQKLHTINFPVLPECKRNKIIQKQYLREVDMSSVQSKAQAIINFSGKFLLLHKNQEIYQRKFHSFTFIDLLLRYMEFFKNVSFVLIMALNIIILANPNINLDTGSKDLPNDSEIYYQFVIAQLIISYALLLFFSLKEMPLLILQADKNIQKRKLEYGSSFSKYPKFYQWMVWLYEIISEPEFLYHLVYTLCVTVAYFYKLFITFLLVDIFIRIPLLQRILMTIWRPKIQLLLTIMAFLLIEYYFSILLYFKFRSETYNLCDSLQNCFSFVFYVTYKVIGGFPGYLFQYQAMGKSDFKVTFFSIFEDAYVIIVFQIFFALLAGIIIDNFSILRAEKEQEQFNLKNYCLVCGTTKNLLNQSTKTNFIKHVSIDHNLWNYFNYYTYLNKKKQNELTEIQQFYVNNFKKKSIEWIPLNYGNYLKQENKQIVKTL